MVSLVDYAGSLLPTGDLVRGWPWLAGEKMSPFHSLVVQTWPYQAATRFFGGNPEVVFLVHQAAYFKVVIDLSRLNLPSSAPPVALQKLITKKMAC